VARSLTRNTAIYTVGAVLNKSLGIFLLPLYTRFLTVADYGALSLLNLLLRLLGFVFLLGVSSAAMRYYHEPGATERERRSVYANALLVLTAGPVALATLLAVAGRPLTHALFPSIAPELVGGILAMALFVPVISLLNGLLRAQERAVAFVAFNLAFFLAQTAAILLFVGGLDRGLTGQVQARTALYAAFGLIALVVTLRYARRPCLSGKTVRQLLVFGLPLVPFFVFAWINASAGRFVLDRIGSLHDVGLFALAAQFAGVLALFGNAAYQALLPHFYRAAGEPDSARSLGTLLTRYVAAFTVLTLAVAAAAEPAILLVADAGYHDAVRYVPLLALAALLGAVAKLGNAYLTYAKRTARLSLVYGLVMIVGLGALAAFLLGAGWTTGGVVAATVILNGALLVLMAMLALRAVPTELETRPLALIGGLALATVALLHVLARPEWNGTLLAVKGIAVTGVALAVVRIGGLRPRALLRRAAHPG